MWPALPALASWGVAAALVGGSSGSAAAVAVGCILTAAVAVGRWRPLAVLMVCTAAVAGSCAWRLAALEASPVRQLARSRAVVTAEAVVAADPHTFTRFGADSAVVRLDVRWLTANGRVVSGRVPVLGFVRGDSADLALGRRLVVHGRLRPSTDADLVAMLDVDRRTPATRGAWWWTAADRVRGGVRHAVRRALPGPRALVPALVDGDDTGLDDRVRAEFRRAGLTHLLAVSGTNLTIVLMLALTVARSAGVGRRRLLLVGFAAVVGFVLVARPDPSVLRAAAMGTVGLIALAVGGRGGMRALSTAIIVLAFVDPWLARSPGFILSACATAGLLIAAGPLEARLRRWMPRWAAVAIAVPLAAQCACLPAIVALSGQVSMVGIAANVVAAPLVAPATIAGLVGGLTDLVSSPVALLPGTVAGWSAEGILTIAHVAAGLAGAVVPWRAPWWLLLGLTPVLMLGLWRIADHPAVVVGLALGLCVAMLRPPEFGWPPEGWLMVSCDVGQGDAIVLRLGADAGMLVDAGPEPTLVDACLTRLHIHRLPLVLITHAHADHLAGWSGAVHGRHVGEVLHGPSGGPGRPTVAGDRFVVGPALIDVLWPPAGYPRPDPNDGTEMNNSSVVLRVRLGGIWLLLAGDVEPEAQNAILASGVPLAAPVLKFAHHGSGRQSPDFVRAVGARLATISVGKGNVYGHPAPSALRLLRQLGVDWRRTDLDGDIAVVLRDGRLAVTTRH